MHIVCPLFHPEKISSKVKQKRETYISPSSSPQISQNIQTLFFEDIFCFVPSRSRDQGLTLCTQAAIFKSTVRPGRGVKQEEAKCHKAFISLISYSFLKYSICFFSTTLFSRVIAKLLLTVFALYFEVSVGETGPWIDQLYLFADINFSDNFLNFIFYSQEFSKERS